ncbi:related to dihydroneopterin aldolase, partial [Cephalotrichum gorgonifer]
MPPATLSPTWSITTAAGQAPSVVRLRNLQSTARIGVDAWGRPTRPQPLLISASVSLASPFASSSSSDSVSADTVHYGHLSKAVLSTLDDIDRRGAVQTDGGDDPVSLRRLLDEIWWRLTGRGVDGSAAPGGSPEPFLDVRAVRCLSVSAQLPKASLVGGCVGLTGTSLFREGEVESYGMCLRLSGIRVPTLIGINDNEREAKQVVVADISIDCLEGGDVYPSLEKAIYD